MKKIVISLSFILCTTLNISIACSEKNWFQTKLDTFAKKLVTRHTYDYNSFEHKRDNALLFILPTDIAQNVLSQQRLNMKEFLKQNEENALQEVKKYLNYDEEKWSKIMTTIEKESEFNLNAMQQEGSYNTMHDPRLPKIWITALKKKCAQHKLKSENLNFGITEDPRVLAEACIARPIHNEYKPTEVNLNLKDFNEISQDAISSIVTQVTEHEMLHVIKNDGLRKCVIGEEVIKITAPAELINTHHELVYKQYLIHLFSVLDPFDILNKQQIDKDVCDIKKSIMDEYFHKFFNSTSVGKKYVAAIEKTADTLPACTDPEVAECAAFIAQECTGGYPDNHNDMLVLNTNWQTSQAIRNSRQLLKNPIF